MLALPRREEVAEHVRLGFVIAQDERRRRGEARQVGQLVQSPVQGPGQGRRGLEERLLRVVGRDVGRVRHRALGRFAQVRRGGLASSRDLRHALRDFSFTLLRGSPEGAARLDHVVHGAEDAPLPRDPGITRVGVTVRLQRGHLLRHPLLNLLRDHLLHVSAKGRGPLGACQAAGAGVGEVARQELDGHEHRPSEAERGDEPREATARGKGCRRRGGERAGQAVRSRPLEFAGRSFGGGAVVGRGSRGIGAHSCGGTCVPNSSSCDIGGHRVATGASRACSGESGEPGARFLTFVRYESRSTGRTLLGQDRAALRDTGWHSTPRRSNVTTVVAEPFAHPGG